MSALDALAGAVADTREAGDRDAVGGVAASYVVAPGSVDELSAALRVATAHGLAVGVRGSGSKLGWGAPPRALDLLVDTHRLDRVVAHAAGDLVVRAQAGVPLTALAAVVGQAGQQLALDPPEGGTVGGVVAAAASGPRRLRYGTPRDLLLGLTVVLADGTVATAGGAVVKNVAGYDLGKLFTGSLGTLGVIAECVLRLHARPTSTRVVRSGPAAPEALGRAVQAVLRSGAVPAAVELAEDRLVVVFETVASAAAVQAQADVVAALLPGDVTVGEDVPARFGERPWLPDEVGVKVGHEISALPAVLGALADAGAHRVSGHAATGVTWAGLATDDAAATLRRLRAAVAPYDGSVVVVHAPVAGKAGLDVWGPVGAAELMRRVKDRFDPEHRMAPGRFVGGI